MRTERETLIKLVQTDMRRGAAFVKKSGNQTGIDSNLLWVRTAVSVQIWEMFYPSLPFATEEDTAIYLVSVWEANPELTLLRWCVIEPPAEDDVVMRATTWVVEPFGLSVGPTIERAPLEVS